jgi:hypothetical protein
MRARLLLSLVTVAGLLSVVPPSHAAVVPVANNDPSFVVVVDNNIENIETPADSKCPGNWADFVRYLALQPYAPDILTFQQVENNTQAKAIATALQAAFAHTQVTYDYVVALSTPRANGGQCVNAAGVNEKPTQTNAIFFRSDRFTKTSAIHWQSFYSPKRDGTDCTNADPVNDPDQDRAMNVKALLHDNIANRDVAVASIHYNVDAWGGGVHCSNENATETKRQLSVNAYGQAALRIWGGDTNVTPVDPDTGATRAWYSTAVSGYGDACGTGPCNHVTTRGADGGTPRRIDFLMTARVSGGVTSPASMPLTDTVTFSEVRPGLTDTDCEALGIEPGAQGCLDYSDHMAVRAYVKYL